jgi:AraC-like DNA-binding protein
MDAILHIGIAQFLFAALLALFRKRRQLSDEILACWFLLMCIFMGLTLLKIKLPDTGWGQLELFPFFFTLGPFLYLYVRTLTQPKPKLSFGDGLHLLPFVIFSVVAVSARPPMDASVIDGQAFVWEMLPYSLAALVSIACYVPMTIVRLNRHRKNLLEFFSYTSDRISLNWLRLVVVGFTVTLTLTLLSGIVNALTGMETTNPGYSLFVGFVAFAFAFTFFGLRQPAIFQPAEDERFVDHMAASIPAVEVAGTEEEADLPEKYTRSSLSAEQAQRYLTALDRYLAEEQPFLHRDLTLQDVAKHLKISQHHLTQAINGHLQKNFYTLINDYRIEEVKRRLVDPRFAHLTVLAIAHDAGFNSKSSFNMTFKRIVGLTPSQFRKEEAKFVPPSDE